MSRKKEEEKPLVQRRDNSTVDFRQEEDAHYSRHPVGPSILLFFSPVDPPSPSYNANTGLADFDTQYTVFGVPDRLEAPPSKRMSVLYRFPSALRSGVDIQRTDCTLVRRRSLSLSPFTRSRL